MLQLLRLNGAIVITLLINGFSLLEEFIHTIIKRVSDLDSLTFNQKILYLTLLEMCYDKFGRFSIDSKIYHMIFNFYKTKNEIITALRKEIHTGWKRDETIKTLF